MGSEFISSYNASVICAVTQSHTGIFNAKGQLVCFGNAKICFDHATTRCVDDKSSSNGGNTKHKSFANTLISKIIATSTLTEGAVKTTNVELDAGATVTAASTANKATSNVNASASLDLTMDWKLASSLALASRTPSPDKSSSLAAAAPGSAVALAVPSAVVSSAHTALPRDDKMLSNSGTTGVSGGKTNTEGTKVKVEEVEDEKQEDEDESDNSSDEEVHEVEEDEEEDYQFTFDNETKESHAIVPSIERPIVHIDAVQASTTTTTTTTTEATVERLQLQMPRPVQAAIPVQVASSTTSTASTVSPPNTEAGALQFAEQTEQAALAIDPKILPVLAQVTPIIQLGAMSSGSEKTQRSFSPIPSFSSVAALKRKESANSQQSFFLGEIPPSGLESPRRVNASKYGTVLQLYKVAYTQELRLLHAYTVGPLSRRVSGDTSNSTATSTTAASAAANAANATAASAAANAANATAANAAAAAAAAPNHLKPTVLQAPVAITPGSSRNRGRSRSNPTPPLPPASSSQQVLSSASSRQSCVLSLTKAEAHERASACRHNAQMVQQISPADRGLSQFWQLLAVVLEMLTITDTGCLIDWSHCTIGSALLLRLYKYLREINDIQTFATVICVLGGSDVLVDLLSPIYAKQEEASQEEKRGNNTAAKPFDAIQVKNELDFILYVYNDVLNRWGEQLSAVEVISHAVLTFYTIHLVNLCP